MRRPLLMLPAVAALVALGCQDGPNDAYQPAPADAGWNNGNGTSNTDGGQSYDAGYPTTGKNVLCSNDFKRQRWSWMLTQPIQPPRKYAGLDMAKDDSWSGLRIEDAEAPPGDAMSPTGGLCQATAGGFAGTCGSGFGNCYLSYWGNAGEVDFWWNVATHLVDQMQLNLGYTGALQTDAYPDHLGNVHKWTVTIGDIIRRDGLPYEIQWNDGTQYPQQVTDIYNAAMATFAPNAGVPFNNKTCMADSDCTSGTQVLTCQCDHTGGTGGACGAGKSGKCGFKDCSSDGNCLVRNDGSLTYMGFRPIVVYIVGQAGLPQPALSTPAFIYNFFSKWEPYSNLPQVVKLDQDGAYAKGTPIGATGTPLQTCIQGIGQTWDQFKTNCVQVHGDTGMPGSVDDVNLNKVTHSLVHDQEHYTANVLGVNQNFTSHLTLADPTHVLLDSDPPGPGDIAQDWTFDIRARGHVRNDYTPRKGKSDRANLRGSALVYVEWTRLMLADIARILHNFNPAQYNGAVRTLGDALCTGFAADGVTPNYQLHPNAGCSGIEGTIVPFTGAGDGKGGFDFSKDPGTVPPGALDPGNNYDQVGYLGFSILKPTDITGALCIDPGTMSDCTFDGVSVWQNMLHHVTRVLGGGDINKLPAELQDRRYYFKWYGAAFVKYLKAYGNYAAKYPGTGTTCETGDAPCPVDLYPTGTVGGGLGPSDVMNQQIDLESLFFDYTVAFGNGGVQSFDKFEYIDREFIGKGAGGSFTGKSCTTTADCTGCVQGTCNAGACTCPLNWIPFDFEYGTDIFGGNQRYDNYFRRMDREEIALYNSMLTDKTHTPGQENNVNITNLFGSPVLASTWQSWACAVGQAGDPTVNCTSGVAANPPLDPNSTLPACDATCTGTKACGGGPSWERGNVQFCGTKCDFTAHPQTGCANSWQACAGGACLDLLMDKNGKQGKPILWNYPGVWSRTPFSRGHSPITLAQADKQPKLGVAKITIPNFQTGPYTNSPITAPTPNCLMDSDCPMGVTCNKAAGTCNPDCSKNSLGVDGYTLSSNKVWCNAALYQNGTTAQTVSTFTPLVPWLEVQPAVGFPIPIDAQHNQWITSGQFDFTGVLESYVVDYLPLVDQAKSSCVADNKCNQGFACDPSSHTCVTDDNTIQIAAIEGADFLGQAFVCQDPLTGDILHVGMYDSAISILDWLAAHPGGSNGTGAIPSAQTACQILVIRSPSDNFVDYIVAKTTGVTLNIGGGQGQGRVTDIVLFDPALIQAL